MAGPIPQDPRYLTLAQASAIVAVSKRTLRRAITDQCLRVHHLGRLVRIEATELTRWIEANGAAGPDRAGGATQTTTRRR